MDPCERVKVTVHVDDDKTRKIKLGFFSFLFGSQTDCLVYFEAVMHQCVHSSIVQGHWHIGKANTCTWLSLYVLAVKCIFISFHVDMCPTNDYFVISLVKNKVGIVIIWHCCRAILLCLHT